MTDARDTPGPQDGGDDAALAGEYALHLLDPEERRAFERRMAAEPRLRDLVREWDERLAVLADEIPPEAPPPRVKAALEARLFEAPERRRWRGWRLGALGATLGAALAVAAVAVLWSTGPDRPDLSAEIAAEDGGLVVRATFNARRSVLEIERVAGAPAAGRAHEVWLIAEGAPAPVSLGVLGADGRAVAPLPDALAGTLPGATLAVSDEPPGGSPTGQPTGEVLALGTVEDG